MKKILMFLFSLLISASLWLYVVTVVSPESTKTYYNIPVVMQGINILTERGLMLTSGAEQTVSLTFTGNRSDLNKINSNNITLIADLTKVDSDGEQVLQYTYSLPGDVPNNAVTVQISENGHPIVAGDGDALLAHAPYFHQFPVDLQGKSPGCTGGGRDKLSDTKQPRGLCRTHATLPLCRNCSRTHPNGPRH